MSPLPPVQLLRLPEPRTKTEMKTEMVMEMKMERKNEYRVQSGEGFYILFFLCFTKVAELES